MGLVTQPGAGTSYSGALQDLFLNSKIIFLVYKLTCCTLGMFGLMAYPALGMYKSLSTASLSRTQQKIMLARQVYGSHLARQRGYSMQKGDSGDDGSVGLILARFEEKKRNLR